MKTPLRVSSALLGGCALVCGVLPLRAQSSGSAKQEPAPPSASAPSVAPADGDEPVYDGRSLVEWLPDLTHAPYTPDHLRAVAAVRGMGAEIFPSLLKHLEPNDPQADNARLALEAVGDTAKAAAPRLKEMFRQGQRIGAVAKALVALGEDGMVIPAVSDPARRLAVLNALTKPTVGAEAVPPIVPLLKDKDPDIRAAAAHALGGIRKRPGLVVPALVAAIRDLDPDPSVRDALQDALNHSDASSAILLPIFVKDLTSTNAWEREKACSRLECAFEGGATDEIVAALTGRLWDPEARVRAAAVGTLGKIIIERRQVIPMGDPVPKDAVVGFPARADKIVSALVGMLNDPDERVRRGAIYALGGIGKTATPLDRILAGALRSALQDHSGPLRALAKEQLASFRSVPENP